MDLLEELWSNALKSCLTSLLNGTIAQRQRGKNGFATLSLVLCTSSGPAQLEGPNSPAQWCGQLCVQEPEELVLRCWPPVEQLRGALGGELEDGPHLTGNFVSAAFLLFLLLGL